MIPHDDYGEIYDLIYELEFGETYHSFTNRTLRIIKKFITNGSNILDIGAGTGRLAIPLAEKGHFITAVEPSITMLNQLQRKVKEKNLTNIEIIEGRVEDLNYERSNFDAALFLFTVISYILDENSLNRAFVNIRNCLKVEGKFYIDVPSRGIFSSRKSRRDNFERRVFVNQRDNDLYEYSERIVIEDRTWETTPFYIKYWKLEYVKEKIVNLGFTLLYKERMLGSEYLVFKKV